MTRLRILFYFHYYTVSKGNKALLTSYGNLNSVSSTEKIYFKSRLVSNIQFNYEYS